jgi:DNA topoisomerase IA
MGDSEHPNLSTEEAIKVRFEKTLTRHVAIKEGYDDLPLDLESLSIGILLVEQDHEVKNGLCKPSERYTRDTLMSALAEIGVQSNGAGNRVTADMAEKGYVEIDTDGRLFAQARLADFIQKLNASFPRMQGLNLVAYLIQTMDEVLSGRKDIEFALEQLDQTLHHQSHDGLP